jgi:FlaA1/EpsC-like NDP-sugar epimerase
MKTKHHKIFKKVFRFFLLIISYTLILSTGMILANLLRFDFHVAPEYWEKLYRSLLWIIPIELLALAIYGQFQTLLTYFSFPDTKRIAYAIGSSALISITIWYVLKGVDTAPRGVILTGATLSFLALCIFRGLLRIYREGLSSSTTTSPSRKRRVAIVGAGTAGATLLRDIQSRRGIGMEVVCFLDDDRSKIGSILHGKPVMGPTSNLAKLVEELTVQKVIIAMPTAKPLVIRTIVEQVNSAGVDHDILPSVTQLLHRQVTVSHLRHVDPEDLLGRDVVELDHDGISSLIHGKIVAVTGAGGSIGSELCRQIAEQNPSKLVLIERSEPALFGIEQELIKSHRHVDLVACASSVCDEESIERLFVKYKPALVFHAAAHKHVPLMESQPGEAIRNNAIGTEIVARQASRNGTSKVIMVSTDKAVNPTNFMGASKRLAEMLLEEQQRRDADCAVAAVRFGNVLGSSGSVVPTFRRQIAEGGPLTVTHPEVTRYFMSIPEAVGLILQSALQARGGEIFVLDMGDPVKIVDLARQMIELSGFRPDEDIKIEFTGLRPGEKLYEEPIHHLENVEPTSHPKIRRLSNNRSNGSGNLAAEMLVVYREAAGDAVKLKTWLRAKIPEYQPAEH